MAKRKQYIVVKDECSNVESEQLASLSDAEDEAEGLADENCMEDETFTIYECKPVKRTKVSKVIFETL